MREENSEWKSKRIWFESRDELVRNHRNVKTNCTFMRRKKWIFQTLLCSHCQNIKLAKLLQWTGTTSLTTTMLFSVSRTERLAVFHNSSCMLNNISRFSRLIWSRIANMMAHREMTATSFCTFFRFFLFNFLAERQNKALGKSQNEKIYCKHVSNKFIASCLWRISFSREQENEGDVARLQTRIIYLSTLFLILIFLTANKTTNQGVASS